MLFCWVGVWLNCYLLLKFEFDLTNSSLILLHDIAAVIISDFA